MDRLDLELYADRLAHRIDRLREDVDAARLRMAWNAFERDARERLGPDDSIRLEAVGLLAAVSSDDEDRALVERRRSQLAAAARLQALVEERLHAVRAR